MIGHTLLHHGSASLGDLAIEQVTVDNDIEACEKPEVLYPPIGAEGLDDGHVHLDSLGPSGDSEDVLLRAVIWLPQPLARKCPDVCALLEGCQFALGSGYRFLLRVCLEPEDLAPAIGLDNRQGDEEFTFVCVTDAVGRVGEYVA